MSNMDLWRRVSKTDPASVKPITGKQYQGNSPKPYYIVERLTEEFGPCGIGWGFTILSERMERLTETEILHVAVVRFWYIMAPDRVPAHLRDTGHTRGELEQIGQTKCVYEKSKGGLMVDEDAPKKSVTDALVKCAGYLGFAGDIFSGRWDDSKYVAELKREFEEKHQENARATWLNGWIATIKGAINAGAMKAALHEAVGEAQKWKDADAEQRFIAAAEAKVAEAKAKAAKEKA